MISLFLAFFAASLSFLAGFLVVLPGDIRSQSLRPLFMIFLAVGFWIAAYPAFVAPEFSTSYAAYNTLAVSTNTLTGNVLTTYPGYTVSRSLSVKDINSFFYIWLIVLFFQLTLVLLWYVSLLRNKALEASRAAADALGGMEREFGR